MTIRVYLSGEIHTDWRDQIIAGAAGLDVVFSSPVTDHAASDDCGVAIMGAEDDKFWHDNKGARLNAIRDDAQVDPEHRILPVAGDLLLWPSFLHHLVHPNMSDAPRISVSFNVVLKWKNDYIPR